MATVLTKLYEAGKHGEGAGSHIEHGVDVGAVIDDGRNRGQIVADDGPEVAHGSPPLQAPPPEPHPPVPGHAGEQILGLKNYICWAQELTLLPSLPGCTLEFYAPRSDARLIGTWRQLPMLLLTVNLSRSMVSFQTA